MENLYMKYLSLIMLCALTLTGCTQSKANDRSLNISIPIKAISESGVNQTERPVESEFSNLEDKAGDLRYHDHDINGELKFYQDAYILSEDANIKSKINGKIESIKDEIVIARKVSLFLHKLETLKQPLSKAKDSKTMQACAIIWDEIFTEFEVINNVGDTQISEFISQIKENASYKLLKMMPELIVLTNEKSGTDSVESIDHFLQYIELPVIYEKIYSEVRSEMNNINSTTNSIDSTESSNFNKSISLAEFNKIKMGISYSQLKKITGGPGTVLSESDGVIMYSYVGEGSLGANANFMFQDGKLINKAQLGLE
jgi:hypothetical protein